MRMLKAYKSKKYLLRILLSLTLLMFAVQFFSSLALQYNAERSAVTMQQEANRKVMNQINYNISYMTGIISNFAVNLFTEKRIVALMTMREPDPMTVIQSVNDLHQNYSLSSFLHSIVVYNGYADQTYAVGELGLSKPDQSMTAELVSLLKRKNKLPRMELLPMNLSGHERSVDFFSLVIYETYYSENTGRESALVLNIKPEWLMENMRAVNDFANPDQSGIFIIDQSGNVILSGQGQSLLSNLDELRAAVHERSAMNPERFGSFRNSLGGEGDYLITFMNTEVSSWKVVSVQPYDAVIGPVQRMKTTSHLVSAALLLFSLILSVIMAHKLYQPIDRMIAQIGTSPSGEREERNGNRDELSHVASMYSQMAQKLYLVSNEQDKQKNIVKNYHLRTIISGSMAFNAGQFAESIAHNELHIEPEGPYRLVMMKLDDYLSFMQNVSYNQRLLYYFAIQNIAEEIMRPSPFRCEIADMRSDHLVMLVSSDRSKRLELEQLVHLLLKIQEVINGYYKLSLSMTVSDLILEHTAISEGYAAVTQYSMYKLLYGKNAILTPDKVRPNMEHFEYAFPDDLERKLSESIRTNDQDGMITTIHQILKKLSVYHFDHIIHGILHVVDILKGTVREMNKNRVVSLYVDLSSLSRQVLEKETIEEIEELFVQACTEIHDKLRQLDHDKNTALMDAIKEIIEVNYRDNNLNLQGISSILHMTPAYVGLKFKQSEFMSVGEYLNEVRLRHAQEYLETKSFSIKEIMELVGFLNESTFFKLFKKKYGVTPREYRLKKSLG
ncbi:AraC family transcriptional regulator [Paenibacillus gansuensis]|uniref:AraC family transcriptional regulator n=1 Tax=Paenibacillus gansuensis TaxID=306542 RepID=A0ABW5PIW1_9BACL